MTVFYTRFIVTRCLAIGSLARCNVLEIIKFWDIPEPDDEAR